MPSRSLSPPRTRSSRRRAPSPPEQSTRRLAGSLGSIRNPAYVRRKSARARCLGLAPRADRRGTPAPIHTRAPQQPVRRLARGRRDLGGAGDAEQHGEAHGVDPLPWLTDVLDAVVTGRITINEIHRLTPWAWQAERRTTTGSARRSPRHQRPTDPCSTSIPLLGLVTTSSLIGFTRGRDLAKRAWSVVHDPNSPAYRLDEDLGEALCPMPPPEDAAERTARAIIGLRTFFQDKRHRSPRRSR